MATPGGLEVWHFQDRSGVPAFLTRACALRACIFYLRVCAYDLAYCLRFVAVAFISLPHSQSGGTTGNMQRIPDRIPQHSLVLSADGSTRFGDYDNLHEFLRDLDRSAVSITDIVFSHPWIPLTVYFHRVFFFFFYCQHRGREREGFDAGFKY